MDRRALIAIALIMLVLVVPMLFEQPAPPAVGKAPSASAARTRGDSSPVQEPAGVAAQRPSPLEARTAPEQFVTVESPLYRLTFSSRGARLVSAELKHYRSFAPGESGPAQLIPDSSRHLTYH